MPKEYMRRSLEDVEETFGYNWYRFGGQGDEQADFEVEEQDKEDDNTEDIEVGLDYIFNDTLISS